MRDDTVSADSAQTCARPRPTRRASNGLRIRVVEAEQRLGHLVERTAGPERIVHLADQLNPLEHVQRRPSALSGLAQRPGDVRPLARVLA